ncbi:prepilin-type N-terminal cleavage/methylation domain-containing protein [Paenibacillus sp. N3/727]|uniref:PilW family protein n=1 Tax=Paenibacillus sp. N3/727 TaxID=2925845 RepID=UPI001F538A42|nr:prepilin-type N-terminal cleavage/methylation domain-containing protein [Paenibacillus sp. N3/727]UNK16088.1 prepilin-type N-terminal cleavage/methylation domain-containing protein [Paenibacillus sp. N3/727]
MQSWKLNQKGLTLVELLASIVLLTIVASLAFSAYKFGVNAFQRANEKSELQDEVRIASHVITSKIRFASEVQLLNACPATFEPGFNYICINPNGRSGRSIEEHVYDTASASHVTRKIVTENLKDPITYTVEFGKTSSSILAYKIISNKNQQRFEVNSEVSLLNIELNKKTITTVGTSAFFALAYKESA